MDGGGAEAPGGAENRGGSPDEGPGVEAKPCGAEVEARDTEAGTEESKPHPQGSDTAKGRKRGGGGSGTYGAATGTAGSVKATGAGARKPKVTTEATNEEREAKEGRAGG